MSSELLGSAQNVLKGNLGGAWDINKGYADAYTDLGIARRFGGAAAAYSLRDIGAMNGRVVRVRRDSDDTEEDFSANQVASGALETFVIDGATQKGLDQSTWQNTGTESFSSTSTDGFSYSNSSGTAFIGVTLSETLALNDSVFVSFNASGVDIPDESPQIRLRDSVSGGSASSSLIGVVNNGFNSFELEYDLDQYSSGDNIVFSEGNTGGGTVTISDFKVFGVSRNGFVETWYDQSGNGFDLKSQSADTQPFIVNNGGFTGGVYSPSRLNNSTKQYLEISDPDFDSTNITSSKFGWLAVMANMEENDGSQGGGVILGNTRNTQTFPAGSIALNLSDTNPNGRMFVTNLKTGSTGDFIGAVDNDDLFTSETIGTAVVDGSSLSTFLNGTTGSGTFTDLTLTSDVHFKIFQASDSANNPYYQNAAQGFIKELMFMQGDMIDDIVTIRNEVNNHYNIF